MHRSARQVSQEQVAAKLAAVPAGVRRLAGVRRGRTGARPPDLLRPGRAGREHAFGSLAYYYEGQEGIAYRDIVTSVIAGNTLLTGHHVPVAGECEIKNVQAMKIMDLLRRRRLVLRILPCRLQRRRCLPGARWPGAFCDRRGQREPGAVARVSWQARPGPFHPDDGSHGPVTLLSVVQGGGGKVSLLAAEGESVPGRCCNRQHEQPLPLLDRRQGFYQPVVESWPGAPLRDWRWPLGR